MAPHPDLQAEQAHIDQAYEQLEAMRGAARRLVTSVLDQSRGGTHQAREERDVMVRTGLKRLEQLDIGERALCFGRIDQGAPPPGAAYHIGRLAVSGPDLEPLVVDWRAPVAEPFYRATGRDPMGLTRRRHFAVEGRRLVGIEDELFALPGPDGPGVAPDGPGAAPDGASLGPEGPGAGPGPDAVPSGALLAAMGRSRSGHMRDIVATVQREQDEVIRAPLPGLLVVQGGPGTGKTAVALHRAAYLLYTHRFPLERQGVLVVGPNYLYLSYIEQVLPSLGESGVVATTVEGLVARVSARAEEPPELARLKGDARMARVLAAAVATRQRPLRHDLVVPFGAVVLRMGVAELRQVVATARRRPGSHNGRRRLVEDLVTRRLAAQYQRARQLAGALRPRPVDASAATEEPLSGEAMEAELAARLRRVPQVADALERMWPRLAPEELLHDLYGAPPLIAAAARGVLDPAAAAGLHRARSSSLDDIPWTRADLALLDEASVLLGRRRTDGHDDDRRTYGHIVVDEAQDLSPMQLRMLARRSLSGSMTLVGDIAQGTGPHAAGAWEEVTRHLSRGRPRSGGDEGTRLAHLSVNYRTPAEVMSVATRVLAVAAPGLRPPRSVRATGVEPRVVEVDAERLAGGTATLTAAELEAVRGGTVGVVAAASLVPELARALGQAGLPVAVPGEAGAKGLEAPVTVIAVELVKGLEFDAVVVVEPSLLVAEASPGTGLRALYVAVTRPTRRLAVVHARPLPAALAGT